MRDLRTAARRGKDDGQAITEYTKELGEIFEDTAKLLDDANMRNIADLARAVINAIDAAQKRSGETTHQKVVVKAVRRLITQLNSDIMNTDPYELNQITQLCAGLEFDAGVHIAIGRVKLDNKRRLDEQREKERQEAVAAREQKAKEEAEAGPQDGADQDLEGEELGFSEADLGDAEGKGDE